VIGASPFAKEVRALLPAFAATLATIWLTAGAADYFRVRIILLLLCFGSIALGSMSIGHEYSHRTLTLLLAQPRRRGELFISKAAVLVPMVAAILVSAALALPRDVLTSPRGEIRALLVLAPLCGLCLAPLLSMLCRSALAAMVFTVAIPGVFMVLGELIGFALYGYGNPQAVDAYRLSFVLARPVDRLRRERPLPHGCCSTGCRPSRDNASWSCHAGSGASRQRDRFAASTARGCLSSAKSCGYSR